MSNATHVGHAKFQGKLYLIDWYPGAIDSDDAANRIVGDLFEIGDNPNLLNQLDIYEGCSPLDCCPHEYHRVVRNVGWDGRSVSAWIYLYAWPLDCCTEIHRGDFSPR